MLPVLSKIRRTRERILRSVSLLIVIVSNLLSQSADMLTPAAV